MAKIPAEKHGGWGGYIKNILPGLLFCIFFGVIAMWLDNNIVPKELFIVNYVLIAIILGLIIKNLFLKNVQIFDEGIDFSFKICLYMGIVLLGAGLNLVEIFQVGSNAIIMVAISITFCILICGWLGKRFFNNERWGHLVGTGIGVCGVSAIIALAPAIKSREREIVAAIGAALLTDVMVLLALPSIGHPLGWSDSLAGFLAGVVPSNTAQCIAIGHAYSDAAGAIATIVKSARNALMPVVILVMTYIYTKRGLPVGEKVRIGILWSKFPKFIVGLLIAAALGTLGFISSEAVGVAKGISTWLFVTCFVAIGAGIDIRTLGKQDAGVIGFGFIMTVILFIYVLLYSRLILML